MVRKPGSMYREIEGQAYCRKEYMGGVPRPKIVQFNAGNLKDKFSIRINLIIKEACQIRDSSIEASRIAAVRYLESKIPNKFRLTVLKYPHHVLREHKMATGAGADRISDGMRAAFGKAVGTAIRANINERIMRVEVNPENLNDAKIALYKASSKISSPCKLEIIKLQ